MKTCTSRSQILEQQKYCPQRVNKVCVSFLADLRSVLQIKILLETGGVPSAVICSTFVIVKKMPECSAGKPLPPGQL